MDLNYSSRVRDVISYSKEEAVRLGNLFIAPEHIMLGLLSQAGGRAARLLERMGVDFNSFVRQLKKKLKEQNR